MNLSKTLQVGLAAGLGAVVCWILALALDTPSPWNAMLALMGGIAGAFVLVRPWEVAKALWLGLLGLAFLGYTAVVAMYHAIRALVQIARNQEVAKASKLNRLAIAAIGLAKKYYLVVPLYAVYGLVVFLGVMVALSPILGSLYYAGILTTLWTGEKITILLTSITIAGLSAFGFLFFGLLFMFLSARDKEFEMYDFPRFLKPPTIARRFAMFISGLRSKIEGKIGPMFKNKTPFRGMTLKERLLLLFLTPSVAFCFPYAGILAFMLYLFFVLKALLVGLANIVLALAVTMRLAAMEGAAAGGGLCLLIFWGKTDAFILPAFAFMATGGAIGMAVYTLRSLLESRRGKWYLPLFLSDLKTRA